MAESHDDYATQLLLSAKDEIVIILPKRVCYHFAGLVAVGWAPNPGTDFEIGFKNWLKDGRIFPWHSHPDTSKEVVTINDLIAPLKKRIEELEAGLIELKKAFKKQPGGFRITCNFIDKLISNGKQD